MLGRRLFSCSLTIYSVVIRNSQTLRNYGAKKSISEIYRAQFYPASPDAPYDFICQVGDPVLRQKCEKVDKSLIPTPGFQSFIDQMRSVHKKFSCVGLSAPQIGLPLQVVVVGFSKKQCEETKDTFVEPISERVLINPTVKVLDYRHKGITPEACASMCGYHAQVSRYLHISVEALNEKGERVSFNSSGYEARVIQHEVDHLEGTLYIDKMEPKSLECAVWQQVNAHKGKGYIKFGPSKKSFLNVLNW